MGMVLQLAGLALKALKFVLKIAIFTGLIWFAVPLAFWGIYETISGDLASLGGGFSNPIANVVFNVAWYICYVLCPATFFQNIIRLVKKDRSFSFIKLILNRQNVKKGFEAKLDGATVALKPESDLSGIVFGKQGTKYVTMPETADGHVLIIGGAGSGKTAAIAIPTLMSWKERVFAIDIKGELFQKTKIARNEAMIKVFNPTDPMACGYDPFYMLKMNQKDISGEARSLAMSICPLSAEVKEPFWIKSAQNMLTGFLIYLFNIGLSFSGAMEFIKGQPLKEAITLVMESGDTKAIAEISQFHGMDDKTLFGVYSELSNHITVFATSDELQDALRGEGRCITPQDLEDGYDIYCCIPEHKLDQWKDLLGMMCNQFLKFFERRAENNKTPILFLIDEFPRLGKIETISNGLATLRSKKIHIALIVQSKSQLNAIYGKDVSEVIADNCAYKAILKASEPNTQEWCSKLVGTYDKTKKSQSAQFEQYTGMGHGTGTSTTTEEKRIIKPEEFAYLRDVVCVFPNGYRRLKKNNYYEDSTFMSRI